MTITITIPTASSIKLRFPEFSEVEDSVIEFAIEEARLEVSTNWTHKYNVAINYLVAHYVACSVAESASAGSDGEIASESWGRFSVTYAQGGNSGAERTSKDSTSYGRRYMQLLNANFGGPVVI